jgi:hypothetical protein
MPGKKRKSVWTVKVDNWRPFTMGGGEPTTKEQALADARCIWAKAKKVTVS